MAQSWKLASARRETISVLQLWVRRIRRQQADLTGCPSVSQRAGADDPKGERDEINEDEEDHLAGGAAAGCMSCDHSERR
jgi:hypothetical protein